MKRIAASILLSILVYSVIYCQSISIHSQSGTDSFQISELKSLSFSLKTSLARYSLNIYTHKGTTQIRLDNIDSLGFSLNKSLNIYTKDSGPIEFPISELDSLKFSAISIPNRIPGALSGSKFMESIQSMSFSEREPLILKEFTQGNIPDFLRSMCKIKTYLTDSLNVAHEVVLEVMSDYLSIGTDDDFCRIPMGPKTAQSIANLYGCILPTRKLVNIIYSFCRVKLEPITYTPVGNTNELVKTFVKHNQEIEAKRLALNPKPGSLTGGLKKDVVITNLLVSKPTSVAIYGWHKLDGKPIQPLYTGHVNYYVDYSHGIRLINSVIWLDGKETTIQNILSDPVLYKMLSDELGIMKQPLYK